MPRRWRNWSGRFAGAVPRWSVQRLIALEAARQAHLSPVRPDDQQAIRVGPQADHRVDPFTRHAVAVALEVDQRCGRDPNWLLHIAIKRTGVGHEACLFVLPDVSDRELRPFGVGHLTPGFHTRLFQPVVELAKRPPAPLTGLSPDVLAPILRCGHYGYLDRCFSAGAGPGVARRIRRSAGTDGDQSAMSGCVALELLAMKERPGGRAACSAARPLVHSASRKGQHETQKPWLTVCRRAPALHR